MKHKIVAMRLSAGATIPRVVNSIVTGTLVTNPSSSSVVGNEPAPVVSPAYLRGTGYEVQGGLCLEGAPGLPTLVAFGGLGIPAFDTFQSFRNCSKSVSMEYGLFVPYASQELGWYSGGEESTKHHVENCYAAMKKQLPKDTELVLSGYCFGSYSAMYLKKLIEQDSEAHFVLKRTYLQNPILSYKKAVKTQLQKKVPVFWRLPYFFAKKQLQDLGARHDVRQGNSNESSSSGVTIVTADGDRVNFFKYQQRLAISLGAEHHVIPGTHSYGRFTQVTLVRDLYGLNRLEPGKVTIPEIEGPFGKSIHDNTCLFQVGLEGGGIDTIPFESLRRLPLSERKKMAGAVYEFNLSDKLTRLSSRHAISGFYISTEGSIVILRKDEKAFEKLQGKGVVPSDLLYDPVAKSFKKDDLKSWQSSPCYRAQFVRPSCR